MYTKHAEIRCKQRAIDPLIVETLLEFGRRSSVGEGCQKLYLDKVVRRQLQQRWGSQVYRRLESLLDVAIVERDGTLITAMRRNKRIRRN